MDSPVVRRKRERERERERERQREKVMNLIFAAH